MEIKGCVHVHIKDGNIANVFSHLTRLPRTCVVHLVPDDVLSEAGFLESHPQDRNELKLESTGKVFDLGDDSV